MFICRPGGEGTSATGETIREGQCTHWLGPGCHGQGYFTLTVNGVLGYRFSAINTAFIGYCAGFYILVVFWPFCCDLQVRTARERRRRGGGVQESRVSVKVEAEGGEWAEEEKAEAEEVEKERGVMPEDEEVKADGGEVEKEKGKHQCEYCGKSYAFEHKLAHHKTWLCKGVVPSLVEVEPRRLLSSNVYHLPTIPEREHGSGDDFGAGKGEENGGAEVSRQAKREVSSEK